MGAKFTVYISKEAKIKSDLEMPHPYSIVIGKGVSIGENCKIFQNVTIGISDSSKFEHIKEDKDALSLEYPSIGNNVVIYSGAKIFGGITINNNVVIGAGSVVNKSIPSNTVVAGNPAKIIKSLNKKT